MDTHRSHFLPCIYSPQHQRSLSNSWLTDNDDFCGTRAKPKGGEDNNTVGEVNISSPNVQILSNSLFGADSSYFGLKVLLVFAVPVVQARRLREEPDKTE